MLASPAAAAAEDLWVRARAGLMGHVVARRSRNRVCILGGFELGRKVIRINLVHIKQKKILYFTVSSEI
jgi:hypothetical protein